MDNAKKKALERTANFLNQWREGNLDASDAKVAVEFLRAAAEKLESEFDPNLPWDDDAGDIHDASGNMICEELNINAIRRKE